MTVKRPFLLICTFFIAGMYLIGTLGATVSLTVVFCAFLAGLIKALKTNDIELLANNLYNTFEEVVDTNQTAKILHELGLDWPKPDEQYLIKLIKYLNKFNFFTCNIR